MKDECSPIETIRHAHLSIYKFISLLESVMTNHDPRPLLFISHRHADRQIADVLRRFLSSRSLGKISVFQSSSVGHTLEIGKNINQQLMEKLDKANPIVLLYTTTDQDWSYCMWECGIATNPASPQNTRIIVLQCATVFFPTLFADRVRVNIQNREDLQTFTKDFLTDPCFFPELGQAIAPDIEPNGPEVRDAAEELYQKFQKVIPPLQAPPEEWSAWPFLQLEISLEHADRICKTQPGQRFQVASTVIQESCLISAGGEAQQLFGMAGFPKGTAFKTLIEIWKERNPQSEPKWLESIYAQLLSGVQWQLPDLSWALMRGVNNVWYVPVLNCVRKISTQNCIQFDIYFYKFDVDGSKPIC